LILDIKTSGKETEFEEKKKKKKKKKKVSPEIKAF